MNENEDYQLLNVEQVRTTSNGLNRGEVIKKEYYLKPDAFKICLMRAKNTKKYAYYYIFLEKCIHYYNEYQELYNQVLMSGKDKRIDEQDKKINEMLKKLDHSIEQNDEMLNDMSELKYQNDDLNDNINDIRETFYENLEDRVPKPEEEKETHEFTLLQYKNNENEFKFLRGKSSSNSKTIKKLFNDVNVITRKYNANPINLFSRLKDKVKQDLKEERKLIRKRKDINKEQRDKILDDLKNKPTIKITYNSIVINKITLNDLLDTIQSCDDERFNVEIP